MYKSVIILVTLVSVTWANAGEPCGDSIQCVQEDLVKYVDELDAQRTLSFLNDTVVVEKSREIEIGRKKEDFVERVMRYFASHEVKLKMPELGSREFEERKLKLKRILIPALLGITALAVIFVPGALLVMFLMIMTASFSTILSIGFLAAGVFKGLVPPPLPSVSYELTPQVSHAHHFWNRAAIENYPLTQEYHTLP